VPCPIWPGVLRDEAINAEWQKAVLELIDSLPYLATTVMIDKHEHKDRYNVWHFNPHSLSTMRE
jgi:hypothetical protein